MLRTPLKAWISKAIWKVTDLEGKTITQIASDVGIPFIGYTTAKKYLQHLLQAGYVSYSEGLFFKKRQKWTQ
jgi:predicted transcriptional regulator